MGTLTEAIHFYNAKEKPTESWMNRNYSHFRPTVEDEKLRQEYQERINKPMNVTKKVMQEFE